MLAFMAPFGHASLPPTLVCIFAGPKRGRPTPGFSIFMRSDVRSLVRLLRSNFGPYTFIKGQRDTGTQGQRDKGKKGQRDKGTWELGNLGTWELGNLGTWEIGNLGTWELRNLGTWELGNLGTLELWNLGT